MTSTTSTAATVTDSATGATIDATQPTNTNPTSGSFTFGNLGSWLTAATNGAGTILGALNNKSPSSPAAKPTQGQVSPWSGYYVWLAGTGLLLALIIWLVLGHKK